MKRRDFMTLLGGATAWPLAVRAQQAAKLPIIGFFGPSTPSAMSQWVPAFVQRLRELGWIEGRSIAIEYRWAEGRNERFGCQSASKFDPRSASNFDPFERRVRAVALAPSELVGVAETGRARVGV